MGDGARPTTVLWLAKGLGPGGMERLLVHHARAGDRERFRYLAAYLVDRPNSVVPELEELGVPCHRLGAHRRADDPRWLGELHALVRDEGVKVVHGHSPLPTALARPMLRGGRRRPAIVYTEHNTWDCYGRATRWANLVTYPLDDAQFAVSREAAASPPARLAARVEVLTHGIDLDAVAAHRASRDRLRAELGLAPDTVVVTTVANLRREKAYDVLLDAAATVLADHDDVVFLSVGHGQLTDEMHRRAAEMGLGDRFRFLGFRADALDLLAASDVFTLASRQEGLPVAYMEATALGLPAVVTAVGGLPDHVDDGVSGALVSPESPEALASALGRVVGDPGLRARWGAAALEHAAAFDAAVAVRRQEQVYAELTG